MVAEEVYYAVHLGKQPGIYSTWPDCHLQVKGYRNAKFKKFKLEKEAELFVQYGFIPKHNDPQFYYAIYKGRQPGVYLTWEECEVQIRGYSNAIYKKFNVFEDAVDFVTKGHGVFDQTSKIDPIEHRTHLSDTLNVINHENDEHAILAEQIELMSINTRLASLQEEMDQLNEQAIQINDKASRYNRRIRKDSHFSD